MDFDATDDPIHGEQEGRFFHGYHRNYCYPPLYVFCEDHLLWAQLRISDCDGADGAVEALAWLVERLRARWPQVRIVVRADNGFTRDALMTWCEANDVHYVLGLAKNGRLLKHIETPLAQAKLLHEQTQKAARVFTEFTYRTLDSWTRERRIIGKAEHLDKGANPRFIVTNLSTEYADASSLYEDLTSRRSPYAAENTFSSPDEHQNATGERGSYAPPPPTISLRLYKKGFRRIKKPSREPTPQKHSSGQRV